MEGTPISENASIATAAPRNKRLGADLNTCMDYADALDNPRPNAHDYAQLEQIYAHLDSSTTIGAAPAGFENADVHAQQNWGTKVHESANGRSAIFERDFGNGIRSLLLYFGPSKKLSLQQQAAKRT